MPVFVLFFGLAKLTAQPVTTVADTSEYPYWISMMQDPDANFYQIQSAFNTYWKNRTITKGCGWKPFKRWESMMMSRITPDGKMPSPDAVLNAYQQYMSNSDNATSISGNWVSQGPFEIGGGYQGLGRLNAIAFHPTNPDIIYVGAPAGGLWVTNSGGNDWTTTTDALPTLGVSAIAIDPVNPAILYIGTGDRDAGDAPGLGVMKSMNNGNTWQSSNTGMGNRIVGDLLIDPSNNQVLYAATTTGLFKSTDAGASWTLKNTGGFKDIAFKPGSSTIIYAAVGGAFFRSSDAGENWFQITAGIPSGARGVLTVTPANPEYVYFLLAKGDNGFRGLYRSTNSGLTFTEMSDSPNIMDWSCDGSGSGGQAWYDLALVADQTDENTIYAGGVNVWKSTNGGASWQVNGHWYGGCGVAEVHADQHIFTANPLNNRIYIGNDGGVYWTENGGDQWNEITTGLVITQSYKIGQSATVDDLVICGNQDNGTYLFDFDTWTAVGGGDGMECAIDFSNPLYRYSTVYYGAINRIIGTNNSQIAGMGVNGITEEGAWVTPFIIDEIDPNTMFIGYKNVWRSFNIKNSSASGVKWKKISTINTGNLDVLEQSPVNTEILYASSGGSFFRCDNVKQESPVWQNISALLPSPTSISDIEASPFDENTVFIIQDTKIFKSTDKGLTWVEITGGLPEIHFSSIVYYKNSQEGLYVGSDAGVYYKDKSLSDWIPFNIGMPNAAKVSELEIYYDPNSPQSDWIKAGTYGRGLWKSDLYYSTPIAAFGADQMLISPGCSVSFSDSSFGVPFQWNWQFDGAVPSSSTDRNPANIVYGTTGIYPVSLTVSNTSGSNTMTKNRYITVSDTLKPMPGYYATPLAFCDVNESVKFTDTSKYCPTGWNWSFSPETVTYMNGTSSQSRNPEVRFSEQRQYSVTLSVTNSNGSRSVTKQNYIMAGGFTTPFIENFESNSFGTKGWTIENQDNLVTWALTSVNGSEPGEKAAWMNFFNYAAPAGRRDRLVSPVLNFTGVNPVFMSFEHAYATRFSTSSDSLIVYISDDCGSSWQRILATGEKGDGTFATVPKQITFFAPQSSDEWCNGTWGSSCNLIDLSQWANKSNIKIAFESFNKFGNNLYIDNISISTTTSIDDRASISGNIRIYPNPADGIVHLESDNQVEDLNFSVLNSLGMVVYSRQIKHTSKLAETINLSNLPKGVYIVKISGNNTSEQQKLILK